MKKRFYNQLFEDHFDEENQRSEEKELREMKKAYLKFKWVQFKN